MFPIQNETYSIYNSFLETRKMILLDYDPCEKSFAVFLMMPLFSNIMKLIYPFMRCRKSGLL